MAVNIVQNSDGSCGLVGQSDTIGAFFEDSTPINASTVSSTLFTAQRALKIASIVYRPDVAGTDAGAVTFVVNKCPSATAPGSGTIVHSGTGNLKGTAATNQSLTMLTTSAIFMAAGDSLCIVPTGVMTSVVGMLTVTALLV
jgi:hypothetical protein